MGQRKIIIKIMNGNECILLREREMKMHLVRIGKELFTFFDSAIQPA
jgi:hypothetical protein